MATADFTEAPLNEERFAESNPEQPVELWAPPLAPSGTPDPGGTLLREEALGPIISEDDRFQPPEQSGLAAAGASSIAARRLMVAAATVAALGAGALAYVLLAPAGEKAPTQIAEAAQAVRLPPPAAPAPAAPRNPPPAPAVLTAVAWPDLPASLTVQASPQAAPQVASQVAPQVTSQVAPQVTPRVAPQVSSQVTSRAAPQVAAAAPAGNTATRRPVPASPKGGILFSQRPSVNIRSTPAANGSVVGTASKGTRFKVTKREGDWVQVENGRVKGWVSSQFLAPKNPAEVKH
ncbi:MAG TPA: SH3 domain-containing protein [Xanthobacteraceae bacterium]